MKAFSLRNRGPIIISTAVFLLIWHWASVVVGQSVIVPSPGEVLHSLLEILKMKTTLHIIFQTLKRTMFSFIVSLLGAILVGFTTYTMPMLRKIMSPVLYFIKAVPVVAVILLILIWSNSEVAPAIVGFLMVFPFLYEGVLNSLTSIDRELISMTKLYKVSFFYRVKDLHLPSIYFGMNGMLSSAFGLAFKSVVAGEVLSHPKFSIGSAIYREKNYLNTSGVLAWLIIMVSISIFLDQFVKLLGRGHHRNYKSE